MQPSLSQNAYDLIRRKMLSGELQPGTQLVNRSLSAELGVSLIPVREALSRLASEGLVEHVPNAGAYVRKLDRKGLIQLYALREQLERFAAAEAAGQIDEHGLANLQTICDECLKLARAIRKTRNRTIVGQAVNRWLDMDIAYHAALIEAADNPWLSKTVTDMRLLSQLMKVKPSRLSLREAASTLLQHHRMLRAIERRDSARAGELMAAHIRSGLQFALRTFEK